MMESISQSSWKSKKLLKPDILFLSSCPQWLVDNISSYSVVWEFVTKIHAGLELIPKLGYIISINQYPKFLSILFQAHQNFVAGYFVLLTKLMKEATEVCPGKSKPGDYTITVFVLVFPHSFSSSPCLLVLGQIALPIILTVKINCAAVPGWLA